MASKANESIDAPPENFSSNLASIVRKALIAPP